MMDNPKPEEPTKPKKELDIDDILPRIDSFPVLDPRSPEEIVGYDEDGLPTGMGHGKWPDFEGRAKKILDGDKQFGTVFHLAP